MRGFVADELDDLLQAAVSTGSAVELITKTLLAVTSPALLADKGDRDSVLMLTGHGVRHAGEALRVKSIGAVTALQIAKHLHKDLPTGLPDPVALRVRNSATHLALVETGDLRKGVVQMCRLVDAVLPLVELDAAPFWGDHSYAVVADLLDEAKSEVARTVAAKTAVAKARLATLTRALSVERATELLAALASKSSRNTIDHEQPQICPVCQQQGWLVCGVERGELEYWTDVDGSTYPVVISTAYPLVFECPVCELELDDDELSQFDFPREINLDPEFDPPEAYEPDGDTGHD